MNIVLGIVSFIVMVIILAFIIKGARHLMIFYSRPCKYCGHAMIFRGEKERKGGNIYLFQCPKCKAWEEIPIKDFLDSDMNNINTVIS